MLTIRKGCLALAIVSAFVLIFTLFIGSYDLARAAGLALSLTLAIGIGAIPFL